MGTTADKLNRLINTKEDIRQEINRAYGTEEIITSDAFNSYIQKLEEHPYYVMRYIDKSLYDIKLSSLTIIGSYAFQECSKLTSISFPNVTIIRHQAFQDCSSLTSVYFPNVTDIDGGAFMGCTSLVSASFPKVSIIMDYQHLYFTWGAFANCSNLTTIYIGTNTSTICTLSGTRAFRGCDALTNIYVPASLVDSYKTATNWSDFADKIKAAP